MCACACELRRARVLSLAQCDVGRGGWSRELHFLPPLRLSSSPPTPSSSSGTASCRHLHNKSPQVLGGERAGHVPVTRAPRRQSCSADPSKKQSRHPKLNQAGDPASQPAHRPSHSRPSPLPPSLSRALWAPPPPFSAPFASLLEDFLWGGEVTTKQNKKLNLPTQANLTPSLLGGTA